MALQHKSKLLVYMELTQEIGFEEYLKYVKVKVSFGYPWVVQGDGQT